MILLSILLPLWGMAQAGGGWCSNNNYSRLYNAKTIVDIKGVIVSVDKITPEKGMSVGIHLMVQTTQLENISVHLGPAWYVDNQEFQFTIGDMVQITGSKVTYENQPAIIAATVKKGDYTLRLRDRNGAPAWNAWKKGKGGKGKHSIN